jgi:hypothetical protein
MYGKSVSLEGLLNKTSTPCKVTVKDFFNKVSNIQDWLREHQFKGSWALAPNEGYFPPEAEFMFIMHFYFENDYDALEFKLRFA